VLAEGYVHNVYFSPDQRRALTSHREGYARLWDVAAAATIGPPLQVGDQCVGVFSRDARLVVTETRAGRAQLWDVESGRSLAPSWQTHLSPIGGDNPSLSPDGRRLLTGNTGTNGFEYRLWDTETGRLIGEPWRGPAAATLSVFSPDGGRLTMIFHGQPADCRDTRTARPIACPLREEGPLRRVMLSPDGLSLYVERMDWSYRIWDSAGDHAISPLIKTTSEGLEFRFSGDSRRLVTATTDGIVTVADVSTGEPVGPVIRREVRPQSRIGVALSHDGRRVATIEEEHVWIWEAATGRTTGLPLRHDNPINLAQFSPDGRLILTTDRALTTRVFDPATGRPVGPPTRYSAQIQAAPPFSQDGKRTLTVCYDQSVWVREVRPPGLLLMPLTEAGDVDDASFSPDGRRIMTISASDDAGGRKVVRILDVESGRLVGSPMVHDEPVRGAEFSPDGRHVASLTEHELRIWEAETGRRVGQPARFKDSLMKFAFSPDSRRVAVSNSAGTLTLFELAGGPPV
jgi:WD40 repeat protein